jgi:hypothetical protein
MKSKTGWDVRGIQHAQKDNVFKILVTKREGKMFQKT